jgi:basic membrane protein A
MALDDWGPNVPQAAKDAVDERQQQIIDGELDPYNGTKYEGYHNDHEDPGITDNDSYLLSNVTEFIEPIQGQAQSD